MNIHTIPGKLEVTWLDDVKAIVDTWSNYNVTAEEFKATVIGKGLAYAKAHGGTAYIVDSSNAKGVFSQQIQELIDTDIFPAFAKGGIKYFITISSKVSAITNMTVKSYSAKTGPHGLKLVELNSVSDAAEWLKHNR